MKEREEDEGQTEGVLGGFRSATAAAPLPDAQQRTCVSAPPAHLRMLDRQPLGTAGSSNNACVRTHAQTPHTRTMGMFYIVMLWKGKNSKGAPKVWVEESATGGTAHETESPPDESRI